MRNYQVLKAAYLDLKSSEPKLRNLQIAKRLEISEAKLLILRLGETVTLLEGDWMELLKDIKSVGYVMALTRNEHCVHERKGIYDNIEFYGKGGVGVAVNPDIDLRFFMTQWEYAFAVTLPRGNTQIHSFQFFNARGEAVHKVWTTPKSDLTAYSQLVEKYKAKEQTHDIEIDKTPIEPKTITPDTEIDVKGFQEAWESLTDTHNFFGMLKKYKVTRTQAVRLAPKGFTQQVPNDTVVNMLEQAAKQEVPIMCFLHSKGCVQIHTGKVKNLQYYGSWYNVMDPKFNLHLNMDSIAEAWIVKKPTDDGIVTSLELFDANGDLITYFFGKRKPGIPELESWRSIIENIEMTNA